MKVLRHVRQRNDADCGVAVAAILANVDYARAWAAVPAWCAAGRGEGAHPEALGLMLRRLTGRWPVEYDGAWKATVLDVAAAWPGRAAAVLREARAGWSGVGLIPTHWVAVADGVVFDPGYPADVPVAEYGDADCLVGTVLVLP